MGEGGRFEHARGLVDVRVQGVANGDRDHRATTRPATAR